MVGLFPFLSDAPVFLRERGRIPENELPDVIATLCMHEMGHFFLRYAELDMHPLDTLDRREVTKAQAGLGYCNITKCCTEVCPEHIHITDNAIIPMKERVVDKKYDPLVWLGSKITRRKS